MMTKAKSTRTVASWWSFTAGELSTIRAGDRARYDRLYAGREAARLPYLKAKSWSKMTADERGELRRLDPASAGSKSALASARKIVKAG
jgi:hypothetical protein